jgi:hypothetical protein
MSMAIKSNYLPVLSAQVDCINELLEGIKQERLSLIHHQDDFRIEKIDSKLHAKLLFHGKGRACHVFLNGYMSFFFTE